MLRILSRRMHARSAKRENKSWSMAPRQSKRHRRKKRRVITPSRPRVQHRGGDGKDCYPKTCMARAPAEPGVTKDNEWLSNIHIDTFLESIIKNDHSLGNVLHIPFVTVDFTSNKDPQYISGADTKMNVLARHFYDTDFATLPTEKNKIVMAMNLDKASGAGTHWTANYIYLDIENKYKDAFYYYFDSANPGVVPASVNAFYGKLKNHLLAKPIDKTNANFFPLITNHKPQQTTTNSECGVYVCFVLALCMAPLRNKDLPLFCNECDKYKENGFQTEMEKIKFLDEADLNDSRYISKYRPIFFKEDSKKHSS